MVKSKEANNEYSFCLRKNVPEEAGGPSKTASLKGPILASLATAGGSFTVGTVLSWTAVALPNIEEHGDFGGLSSDQKSWIGSIVALGALLACPLTGFSIEKFGRKATLIGVNIPMILGWLFIIFATSPLIVIVGRFFTGFALGCLTLVIPVYITEVTEQRFRGAICSTFPIFWALGLLFLNSSAILNLYWVHLSILCGIPPILLALGMLFVPESPTFYVRVGKIDLARKSLKWLRGNEDFEIEDELDNLIKASTSSSNKSNKTSLRDLLQPSSLKPTLITIFLFVFQQFSGFNAVVFYTTDIFEASGTSIDTKTCVLLVGVVNLFAVIITSALTDKAGRKLLLIISSFGITVSLTALGTFFYLKETSEGGVAPEGLSWLPLASLLSFMISFNCGMGPMPFLVMGEILPSQNKGILSSITISIMWILVFLITKTFDSLTDLLGTYGCFWLFAAFTAVGIVFEIVYVPETKGKSLEEIQKLFS